MSVHEIKIIEWNINQATNTFGYNSIPMFVLKELIEEQKADIFVITEFCRGKDFDVFVTVLDRNNYGYAVTNNSEYLGWGKKHHNQNDILISWNKSKCKLVEDTVINNIVTKGDNNKPNFLCLDLEIFKEIVSIAGVRITVQTNDSDRKEQMKRVFEIIEEKENVVIAGDFNNKKRSYTGEWSIKVLMDMAKKNKYNLLTPSGQSLYQDKVYKVDNEIADDHFLTKGITIEEYQYDRTFTDRYASFYPFGHNFQGVVENIIAWSIVDGSGVPDHAMLIGTMKI